MTRRCSHCSNNGHNSRTCPTRGHGAAGGGGGVGGLKLFGVKLTDGSIIKKSASMGNLSAHYHSSSSAAASPNPGSPLCDHHQVHVPDGYLSDDPAHASCSAHRRADRKKGVPWTEEEHRLFLLGLNKLGKGDWRGISRNFVTSRTPTQVASHAQKYFIRQTNSSRRKRRSSLFDMVTDSGTDQPQLPEEQFMLPPPLLLENDGEQLMALAEPIEPDNHNNSLPSLNLSLRPDFDSMDATSTTHEQSEETKETETPAAEELTPMIPSFFPAFIPVSFPVWTTSAAAVGGGEASHHQVLKPIPVLRRDPVNVDELVGLSQLSLGDGGGGGNGLSPLSLKLLGEPSRQSAFHASATANGTGTVVYKNNGSAV